MFPCVRPRLTASPSMPAGELRVADLTRILKAIGVAASALVQIFLTQVRGRCRHALTPATSQPKHHTVHNPPNQQVFPALDVLVQCLSHLHGLSRWPYHFAALGLQPARVASALEAAVSLRVRLTKASTSREKKTHLGGNAHARTLLVAKASSELLIVAVRRAASEMHGFLSWLVRVHRKMRDDQPPAAEETPPISAKVVASFLLDPSNVCTQADAITLQRTHARPACASTRPRAPHPRCIALFVALGASDGLAPRWGMAMACPSIVWAICSTAPIPMRLRRGERPAVAMYGEVSRIHGFT